MFISKKGGREKVFDGSYGKAKTFSPISYDTTTIYTLEDLDPNRDDSCISKSL